MLGRKTRQFATQNRNRNYRASYTLSGGTQSKNSNYNSKLRMSQTQPSMKGLSHSQPLSTSGPGWPPESIADGSLWPDVELSFRESIHRTIWEDVDEGLCVGGRFTYLYL